MINQSFKVQDLNTQATHQFSIDENGNWIARTFTSEGVETVMRQSTQNEVEMAYNYFTSFWQDFDVTEFS